MQDLVVEQVEGVRLVNKLDNVLVQVVPLSAKEGVTHAVDTEQHVHAR